MGSATRGALADARDALSAISGSVDLATGEQLLQAARVIGGNAQLRSALADDSADNADKRSIVDAVFAGYTAGAKSVLGAVSAGRWSSDDDLVAGVEELGIRAIAESTPAGVSIETELFEFERAVASNSELELAVGSKLGSPEAKAALVERLLGGNASQQTVAILRQLVQQPRGRRIGELLRFATRVVADQAGLAIATVTSAAPITQAQLERLATGLATKYGRAVRVNSVIDPAVIGGVRVQIGDDVIDGSIASKLTDLKLQLVR